jgi:hypothetical protein
MIHGFCLWEGPLTLHVRWTDRIGWVDVGASTPSGDLISAQVDTIALLHGLMTREAERDGRRVKPGSGSFYSGGSLLVPMEVALPAIMTWLNLGEVARAFGAGLIQLRPPGGGTICYARSAHRDREACDDEDDDGLADLDDALEYMARRDAGGSLD